ncbi:MAG: B12-binding domain-containing radical SAM protein [Candidatus Thorarchaeota archaeon]
MSREKVKEHNAIIKDMRTVDVIFGYCYPSTYRAGMTSLATHLFYSALNSRNDTSCERYFRYDVPDPGRSVETGRLLQDNHIVGFSLTYEEDILHVVQMLEKGKIPVLINQRSVKDPIVIAGGPVVSANPEPYVDFIDAFVIGEGDLVIHDLVSTVKESESRSHALTQFAEIPGVYVPSLEQSSVSRLIMVDLDEIFHPTVQIVPDVPKGAHREPVFGKSFLTEVTRGCGHSCKFCLTGHICRPRRVRSLEKIIDILDTGLERTPVGKVSLIGSSLGDHDRLEDIAEFVVSRNLELSVPSLRADSVTDNLLAVLVKGGQRTLTIAPETGSPELRRNMGKGLEDSDIEDAVKRAAEAGLFSVKLYYIVGLPDETESDVRAIAGLTKKLAKLAKIRITASVNPFIPKANTRLERNGQLPIEELRRRLKIINSELRNVPRVTVESLDPRNARIQAALSLGDRSIGKVIRIAASQGGLSGWRRAEKETGVSFFSIANDTERIAGKLPWSFLRTH